MTQLRKILLTTLMKCWVTIPLIFCNYRVLAAEIGYGGRMTESNGKPIEGPADMKLRFYSAISDGDQLGTELFFPSTDLMDGVFQLSINLNIDQLTQIFGDGSKSVFVEIEAKGKVYPRQKMVAVPLALRVPVDNTNLIYNADGKLTIDHVDASQVSGLNAALSAKASVADMAAVTTLKPSNNLSDISNKAAARSNLGLSSLATASLVTSANGGVTITNSAGSVSLATVQDIRTSASPTFAGVNFSNGSTVTTGPALVTLTDAATITVDASLGTMFQVTLGGNRTLAAPSNLVAGATYLFKFVQDGTGNRTLSFDPAYVFPTSVSAAPLSTSANAVDIGQFASDGTKLYYLTGWLSSATVYTPPSSLTATAVSPSQINLAWVDTNSTEIGYLIQRSPDNSSWTTVSTTAANATSYSDTPPSDGTRYYYRVITVRDAGNSAPATANTWTLMLTPTSFNASANSSSSIVLTWTDNTTMETGYAIERSLDGSTGWSVITTTAANAVTYTDTGFTQNSRYYYRIRAVNANTVSAYTATVNEITLPASGICGTNASDNCYIYGNAAINTQLSTPGGKNIIIVYANGSNGFKIWQENSGNRILRANGLDQWTKKLNANGRGLSGTDFTDANLGTSNTLLAGRVCPTNVYIDDSNMTTTGNCVYYTPGYAAQRLDGPQNDCTTDQTTVGSYRLGSWNTAAGGNGTAGSWYEGNIQTCVANGMRLPLLYETTAGDPGTAKPTDAAPTWSNSANGVPSAGGSTWTSSAYLFNNNVYWAWVGTSTATNICFSTGALRCVVP